MQIYIVLPRKWCQQHLNSSSGSIITIISDAGALPCLLMMQGVPAHAVQEHTHRHTRTGTRKKDLLAALVSLSCMGTLSCTSIQVSRQERGGGMNLAVSPSRGGYPIQYKI